MVFSLLIQSTGSDGRKKSGSRFVTSREAIEQFLAFLSLKIAFKRGTLKLITLLYHFGGTKRNNIDGTFEIKVSLESRCLN